MKRSRFRDEQIIAVIKGNDAGAKVDELCRRYGISTATFYSWRKKFGGMEASDARKLRDLEAENARLKRIVADQMLDVILPRKSGRGYGAIRSASAGDG